MYIVYIRDYFSMFICAFILSFFASIVFACPILIIILLIPNFLIFCYLKKKNVNMMLKLMLKIIQSILILEKMINRFTINF